MSSNLLSVLPEVIMTLTGILVMVIEPLIPANRSRKVLG